MKRRLAIQLFGLLALLVLPAPVVVAQTFDYEVARDTPDWFKESFLDFGEDVNEAAEEGKRVMIYFGQDGCPYCQKLHDLNYRQAEIVAKMREHLDSIAVNMFGDVETVWVDGNEYSEKDLAKALNIQFTPTLLFLDENGKEILRLAGYQPPVKFNAALDYVINKKEAVSFADYLRASGALAPAVAAEGEGGERLGLNAPPHQLTPPRMPTAVLVTQRECAACEEWRAFLQSDEAEPWQVEQHIVEVDLYGGDALAGGDMTEAEWAEQQQVAFVPALIFLNADGSERFRVDGYLRPFHLDSVFEYVVSGAYKNEPEFQRFLQARADALREQGQEVQLW